MIFILFILKFVKYSVCEDITVSYDIEGPNKDSIRIVEAADVWNNADSTTRPFNKGMFTTSMATTNINSPLASQDDDGMLYGR